jgi:hypothetical protein
MRRKRLQHVADTLCHMFCGWRLVNSYNDLERLGSGTLHINALNEVCTFDGRLVPTLSIAGELGAWVRADLTAHHIDISEITDASLDAELVLGTVPRKRRGKAHAHFTKDGQIVAPDTFIALDIECNGRVATDEKVYLSRYRSREAWPAGWP